MAREIEQRKILFLRSIKDIAQNEKHSNVKFLKKCIQYKHSLLMIQNMIPI